MCDVLNVDALLAFLLSERAEVSFDDLRKIRDLILAKDPDILVDISEPALDLALECYPHIFTLCGDRIVKAPTADRFLAPGYFSDEFLSTITEKTSESVRSVLTAA